MARLLLRALIRWLARLDRAAGLLAHQAGTFGQAALVALGVHLAGDHLDDRLRSGITAVLDLLDRALAPHALALADRLGLPGDLLLPWTALSPERLAPWGALGLELAAAVVLVASFLFTPRAATPSWRVWYRARSVEALVLPVALAGVLAAGCWSLAMAAEDLLPTGPATPWAAAALGLAAALGMGAPAWSRAVSTLEPSRRALPGLLRCLVTAPVGLLAWMHGVPLWGWL